MKSTDAIVSFNQAKLVAVLQRKQEFYQKYPYTSLRKSELNMIKEFKNLLRIQSDRLNIAEYGKEALIAASTGGYSLIVRYLLAYREVQDKPTMVNAFNRAVANKNYMCLWELLKHEEVKKNLTNDNNWALKRAVYNQDILTVKCLLQYPEVRNLIENDRHIIENLTDEGADTAQLIKPFLNYHDQLSGQFWYSILDSATNNQVWEQILSHLGLVKKLIEIPGFKKKLADEQSDILPLAVRYRYTNVVAQLLKHKAVRDNKKVAYVGIITALDRQDSRCPDDHFIVNIIVRTCFSNPVAIRNCFDYFQNLRFRYGQKNWWANSWINVDNAIKDAHQIILDTRQELVRVFKRYSKSGHDSFSRHIEGFLYPCSHIVEKREREKAVIGSDQVYKEIEGDIGMCSGEVKRPS